MTIVPDTKDWTWVLHRACPECGFDSQRGQRHNVPAMIREVTARWGEVLERPDGLTLRSSPTVWSPLEYGCHVRDVFRLYGTRLQLMLTQENPIFPNWDQDATAVADRYADQDPAQVSVELRQAGEALARQFQQVHAGQWERTGRRSDGAHFTIESFARYLLHDPVHHLYDVSGQREDFETTGTWQ